MGCWCSRLPVPNRHEEHPHSPSPAPPDNPPMESPFKSAAGLAKAATEASDSPAPSAHKEGSNTLATFRSNRELFDGNNTHMDLSSSTLKQSSGPGGLPSATARSSSRLPDGGSCSQNNPLLLATGNTFRGMGPGAEAARATFGGGMGSLEMEEQEYDSEGFSNPNLAHDPSALGPHAHAGAGGGPAGGSQHAGAGGGAVGETDRGESGEMGSSCFSRELLESVVPMIVRASFEACRESTTATRAAVAGAGRPATAQQPPLPSGAAGPGPAAHQPPHTAAAAPPASAAQQRQALHGRVPGPATGHGGPGDGPDGPLSTGSVGGLAGATTAANNIGRRPTFIRGLTRDSFLMNNTTGGGGGGSGYMLRTTTAREGLLQTDTRWPPFQMGNPLQLTIGSLLGRGGCGSVYIGEWRGRPVAVKVVQQVVVVPLSAAAPATAGPSAAPSTGGTASGVGSTGSDPAYPPPPPLITPLIDYFSTSSGGNALTGLHAAGAAGAPAPAQRPTANRAPHLPDATSSVKRLRHPNILRTHAYAALSLGPQLGGVLPARHEHHVVLELCDGGSLRSWLDEAHRQLTAADAAAGAGAAGGGGFATAATAAAGAAALQQAIDRAQAHMARVQAGGGGAGGGGDADGGAGRYAWYGGGGGGGPQRCALAAAVAAEARYKTMVKGAPTVVGRGQHHWHHHQRNQQQQQQQQHEQQHEEQQGEQRTHPTATPPSPAGTVAGSEAATPSLGRSEGPQSIPRVDGPPSGVSHADGIAAPVPAGMRVSRIQSCPGGNSAAGGEAHSTALAAAAGKAAGGTTASASETLCRLLQGLTPQQSQQLQLLGLTWVSDGEDTGAGSTAVPKIARASTGSAEGTAAAAVASGGDGGGGGAPSRERAEGIGCRGGGGGERAVDGGAWIDVTGDGGDGSCVSMSAMSDPSVLQGPEVADKTAKSAASASAAAVAAAAVAGLSQGPVPDALACRSATSGPRSPGRRDSLDKGAGGDTNSDVEATEVSVAAHETGSSFVVEAREADGAAAAATAPGLTGGTSCDLNQLEAARTSPSPPTAELAAVWAGSAFQHAYGLANGSIGSYGGCSTMAPADSCTLGGPLVQQHYVILGDPDDDDDDNQDGNGRVTDFSCDGVRMYGLYDMSGGGTSGSIGGGGGRGLLRFKNATARLQQLDEDSREGPMSPRGDASDSRTLSASRTMTRTVTGGSSDPSASASATATAGASAFACGGAAASATSTTSGDASLSNPQHRRASPALMTYGTTSTFASGRSGDVSSGPQPTEGGGSGPEPLLHRVLKPPVCREPSLLGPTVTAARGGSGAAYARCDSSSSGGPAAVPPPPPPGPLVILAPPVQPDLQPHPPADQLCGDLEEGAIVTTLLNRRAMGMVHSILRAAGVANAGGGVGGAGGGGGGGGAAAAGPPPPPPPDPMLVSQLRHLVTALDCLTDVAAGLCYLHGVGMIHGDVKSGNVLLKTDLRHPRGFVLKLADFGFSRVLEHGSHTYLSRPSGTLAYLSPEMLTSYRQSSAADLYAFGIMMWEVVTAQPLFRGLQTPQLLYAKTHNADWQYLKWPAWCPHDVRALARRCAEFHPAARLTAQQARTQLEQLRGQYEEALRRDFGEEPPVRPAPAPLLAPASALASGGAAVAHLSGPRPPSIPEEPLSPERL